MFDFRLKVFHTVARRQSFTKAAEELCISQPAVSKHIREIEQHFRIRLFERSGSRIRSTLAADLLMDYCRRIFELHEALETELQALSGVVRGRLRIGASTTIAHYVLPPVLADFHKKYKDISVSLSISNTEKIERELKNRDIDFGIVEGQSKSPLFRYTPFIEDELLPVVALGHPLSAQEELSLETFLKTPLLLREPGSGTLEVIAHALRAFQLTPADLSCEMRLGSSESIKSYLQHSACMAFLSRHAIARELKHGDLHALRISGLHLTRRFHFIQLFGVEEDQTERFISFARHHNFR